MSAALLGTYEAPPAPPALRGLRRVLLLTAVLTTVGALASLSLAPPSTERFGEALWALVPAGVAVALARRVGSPGPWVGRGVVGLAAVMGLLALVRLSAGELQGLTNLLLPVLLLALALHPDARRHRLGAVPAAPFASSARRVRRRVLFRRGLAGDGGQVALESVGVLAVAALVIGIGTAAIMAAPVEEGTEGIVCSVQDSRSCGSAGGFGAGGGTSTSPGGGPGPGPGAEGSGPWCSSIGDCALRVLGQAGSLLWQVADAAIDDIVGVVELVMDPSQLIDALEYLFENPGDALWALVWDAESQALWAEGDYGGAIGRVVWNVASVFIPFVGAGKVAAALGDLGRLGRVTAGADDLSDLATAAQRAQDAARLGNLDEAADIAADARRYADDLDARARAAGCVAAGTIGLQVLAVGAGRGTAGVVVVAGGGLCDTAGDAARQADEAADAAAVAAAAGRPRPAAVPGPGGETFSVVPDGAVGRLVDNGKGLRYDVPAGTQGLHPNVTEVRVMDPVTNGPYPYPDGYVVYMNQAGQAINPVTGRTVPRSDPYWHLPLDPP